VEQDLGGNKIGDILKSIKAIQARNTIMVVTKQMRKREK
jgi:hypothetical protein